MQCYLSIIPLVAYLTGSCLLHVGYVLTQNSSSLRDASWPLDLKTPFLYPTYAPANIDTSAVRLFNCSKPLHYNLGSSDSILLQNNGYFVVGTINQPTTVTSVTGGVLGNDVYSFHEQHFLWNNDKDGNAANTIDGQGSPILTVAIYYNRQYKSYENAQNFRDGIAIFLINVDVQGYLPNPLFGQMEKALRKIVTAGSQTTISIAGTIAFPEPVPAIKYYYAYPGAFLSATRPIREKFSATIIQYPKSAYQSISIPQFTAFTNLVSIKNSPLDATIPQFPMGSRPVVEAHGITQTFYP